MNNNLQRDVRFLSELLDRVTAEQFGSEALRSLEELRQISRERRAELPGAAERLVARIAAMTAEEIRAVIPALIIFFDLANMAEDTQRIRVLRQRQRAAGDAPRQESIGAAILQLKQHGHSPEQLERLIDRLRVGLVFTAHPTEAKRRTTRRLIRSLREALHTVHSNDLLESEHARLMDQMHGDLTILSQIDLLRPERPTVMQEVERGLFFIEELWQVVPRINRELREAASLVLHRRYETPRAFLKFGSWIGGDRDGNPLVTTDVTARTLRTLRQAAIRRHQSKVHDLARILVMSDRGQAIPATIRQATARAERRWPALSAALETVIESERYRRWLKVIEWRLQQTASAAPNTSLPDGAYATAGELLQDVDLLAEALRSRHGEAIVDCRIDDWRDQVRTFGLHFAALDVRQDSHVHVKVITALCRAAGLCEDYSELDETERGDLLRATLSESHSSSLGSLGDSPDEPAGDTLALFRLLAETIRDFGTEPIGGAVISMTHQLSDVLAVLWLWQHAWRQYAGTKIPPPHLPIVPLFETIDDLARSAEILDAMLGDPEYRAYLETQDEEEPTQVVMVGYSDSTKDGGYLAASWGLYRAQERLAEVADRHNVRMIVFHGRGGALGRGGGPAARAILSLPPRAVGGAVRMTEQGEVLAERYDDPQIAHRHLEQVSWATLLVEHVGETAPAPEWTAALDQLSQSSLGVYRRLVEHPGFLTYFDQATPIGDIETLPIGSRPARRRGKRSLADLRAIPWTFAWTQSRHMIPAWYGLGSAFESHVQDNGGDWSLLQSMYEEWALFRAVVDNADLALAKSDMGIAHRYAELASGDEPEEVWSMIREEFARSRAAVLLVTGQRELLGGIPWLQRSIQERNPYVDPLNLIQIELIRRLRVLVDKDENGNGETAEDLRDLIRLSIQGVAAGLRTTG